MDVVRRRIVRWDWAQELTPIRQALNRDMAWLEWVLKDEVLAPLGHQWNLAE
jgi:hypothetical protein